MKKWIRKYLNKKGYYHLAQMESPLRSCASCYDFIKKCKNISDEDLAKNLCSYELVLKNNYKRNLEIVRIVRLDLKIGG